MAQAIKSVLFFDYDSIYRSLNSRAAGSGEQLGARAGAWLEAIESGELIAPRAADVTRRRLMMKRCYADPRLLGKNRGWLTANGVQIVDCASLNGPLRSPTDVHMVLDVVDALDQAADFDEFILLSAEVDLTPLLFRLRAHNRRVVVYVGDATGAGYRAFSEATVSENLLLALLARPSDTSFPRETLSGRPVDGTSPLARAGEGALSRSQERTSLRAGAARAAEPPPPRPLPAPPPRAVDAEPRPHAPAPPAIPARSPGPIDRENLAALVRRVHQATSVPLFSPKAYGDLFRLLAEDIAANGYRFQQTAENLTAAMLAAGRNVNKRQIGFVVKGLALKGHMFSAEDTPRRLAEVFHEQVLYLVGVAGLELAEADQALVAAWIVGEGGARPAPTPSRQIALQPAAPTPAAASPPPAARPVAAISPPAPEPSPALRRPPEREIPLPPRRALPERAAELMRRPSDMPSLIRRPPQVDPEPLAARPVTTPPEETPRATPRPVVSRPMPLRPATNREPETPSPASAGSGSHLRPAAPPAARENLAEAGINKREMENSILAAIAEAVDVLVDDEPIAAVLPERSVLSSARGQTPVSSPATSQPAAPADPDDGDDIGDEIQRILASYSQNRK